MSTMMLIVCFLFSMFYGVVVSSEMQLCYDLGTIHPGPLNRDDVDVLNTQRDTRSKLECATLCYADWRCMTAVYRHNGDCLLVRNFTNTLTLEDNAQSYWITEEIIEMKSTSYTGRIGTQRITCPSECTGYSVCFMDCSAALSGSDFVEVGCMDLSTTQYNIEECGFRPSIQMKEYYLSNLDKSTSSSEVDIFSVTFEKLYDWTTLQVKFRGTLRTAYGHTTGTWGAWRILFNGNECTNPGNIESISYNTESDTDHYKAQGIIGICYGLTAGSYSISLRTYTTSTTEFRVGYATHATRLYVEEIGQTAWTSEPAVKPCPSLPAYNFREHASTTEWGHEPTTNLWDVSFTKMEADTWLRINVDMVLRQHSQGSSDSTCATWYIKIDSEDCSPVKFGKTVANLQNAHSVNNEMRSVEVEGHCSGISAGSHTINFGIGSCDWGTGHKDTLTGGWNGNTNRIVIEEFRPSSNIIGVMDSDGQTVYRVPQFNMVAHGDGHVDDGTDEGEISWSIPTYNKIYESSGVRVMLSYDARVYWGHGDSANYDACCRHYVKFNGAECTDPGTLEGINYLNKNTNLHRPNLIEGTCEGLSAGDVTITIWAGKCKGYSKKGECHFGWNSYQHLMISETFVDREIIEY